METNMENEIETGIVWEFPEMGAGCTSQEKKPCYRYTQKGATNLWKPHMGVTALILQAGSALFGVASCDFAAADKSRDRASNCNIGLY